MSTNELPPFAYRGNEKVTQTVPSVPDLPKFAAKGNKQPAKRVDSDPSPSIGDVT